MRTQSRRMALCGLLTALAVTLLMLGGMIPLATFCAPLLAIAVLLPVLEEFGPRYAWAAWGAASLLGLLLAADRELALVYLFFGWYPILRPRLEAIPLRAVRVLVKIGLCNLLIAVMYGLALFVFQMEALAAEFAGTSRAILLATLVLGNPVFLLADVVLGRFQARWRRKLRRRFFK